MIDNIRDLSSNQESYLFDWSKEPFTDHPSYKNKLVRGKHNLTIIDGKDAGECIKFQTGKNGWVERNKLHNGKPYLEYTDNFCPENPPIPDWEYEKLVKQTYNTVRVLEDGTRQKKWSSNLAVERIYGNVKYFDLRESNA